MNDENPVDDQTTDAGNVEGNDTPGTPTSDDVDQAQESADQAQESAETEASDMGGPLGNVTEAVTDPLVEEQPAKVTGLPEGSFGADRAEDQYKEARTEHAGPSSMYSPEEQARRDQAAADVQANADRREENLRPANLSDGPSEPSES